MVTPGRLLRRRVFLSSLLVLLAALMLSGCGPKPKVTVAPTFKPAAAKTVYIIPFTAALVPESFRETVFNDFVDLLNSHSRETGVTSFVILKEEMKDVDPAWLSGQHYISGDIWSYVEESGCCATNIRVKARAYLTEPGMRVPSVEIFLPMETFFDHDKSSVERERDRLAHDIARELARRIIAPLATRR
ncbi:hypothetical protein [Geobacter sp.]|uniref:hypothetical protein n=1 Tax=Geobacter sp. TaxID=46610 RepID=UPI002635EC0A|nr:hypothetical protein [Geobacter sp.]